MNEYKPLYKDIILFLSLVTEILTDKDYSDFVGRYIAIKACYRAIKARRKGE